MARQEVTKRPVKIGNYVQEVDLDPEGVLESSESLGKLSKVESDYLKGTGGRISAIKAIRRTRAARKKQGIKEG